MFKVPPKPTIHPTEDETMVAIQKAMQEFKIAFDNYKNSNFPEKTGTLKRETKVYIIGTKIQIVYPDYLEKQKIYPDFLQFVKTKWAAVLKSEINKLEGQE